MGAATLLWEARAWLGVHGLSGARGLRAKKKKNGLEPSLLLEGGDVQMSVCFEFKMELRAPLINPLFQATNWFVFPLTLP